MKSRSHGFSLIEVIIAIAVLTIASLAFTQVIKSQIDGNTFVLAQAEANQKMWELSLLLRDKTTCSSNIPALLVDKNFLIGKKADTIVVDKIMRGPGTDLLVTGATTPEGIKIEKMFLGDFNATFTPTIFGAKMHVEMSIAKSGLLKKFMRSTDLLLTVTVAGGVATITSCSDGTSPNQNLADLLGAPGFPNDILCNGLVFTVRSCTSAPPNTCTYKIPGYQVDNNMVRYTRHPAPGVTAFRSDKEHKGGHCPLVLPVDGKSTQGPY